MISDHSKTRGSCPYNFCQVPEKMLDELPPGFDCYINKNCFFVLADQVLKDILRENEHLGDLLNRRKEEDKKRAKKLIKVFLNRYKKTAA